jgi:hypothetical protein
MRDLIIELPAGKAQSEPVQLNKSESELTILPFTVDVKEIYIVFKFHVDLKRYTKIEETNIKRTIENIGLFESFWFEYTPPVKNNYSIKVHIN